MTMSVKYPTVPKNKISTNRPKSSSSVVNQYGFLAAANNHCCCFTPVEVTTADMNVKNIRKETTPCSAKKERRIKHVFQMNMRRHLRKETAPHAPKRVSKLWVYSLAAAHPLCFTLCICVSFPARAHKYYACACSQQMSTTGEDTCQHPLRITSLDSNTGVLFIPP